MTPYNPLRQLPEPAGYGKGDVFVLFGELFGRGYANGIVDEAKKAGMTVIGATVGRRDNNGPLRPLTPEELAEAEANLGGKIINVPLEAGFDLEPAADGFTPADRLKGVKPDSVAETRLDMGAIGESRLKGIARFRANLASFAAELEGLVPAGANLLVAHTMAGGIPRARTLMPLLNRVFKGQEDRYLSSEVFWNSDVGRLCSLSFDEVTADTFDALIAATAPLRGRVEGVGGKVAYTAYGYHGCGVLVDGEYRWQSYTPYLQGWAKIRLEQVAEKAWRGGVRVTVYNSPEIQTNSSALFLGVEISLYPLLAALKKEGGGAAAEAIWHACRGLLAEGATLETLLARADAYLGAPLMAQFGRFEEWPHHNTPEQAAFMLSTSDELMAMSADPKNVVCAELSRAVFQAVGRLMFDNSWAPEAPVVWLSHDVIARRLIA
ncbi:hypothetical protein [Geobacter sp.]|uniref:enoyl ACP reductase FabMG family protein n=1 Tax=Geobacter sp. TaxID=46610 RepID=UPI0026241595|nr:hypothetical protein [Geobacter sp.]